jgi:hypothetical protein
MLLRAWIAGFLIAVGSFDPAGAADQPDTVAAVQPGGPGVLTKCRDWLVARSCHHYHHISLPSRVAVGDTITLSYGSSPKGYDFPVARIALEGNHCTIFSEAGGDRQGEDKIEVAPCYQASNPR